MNKNIIKAEGGLSNKAIALIAVLGGLVVMCFVGYSEYQEIQRIKELSNTIYCEDETETNCFQAKNNPMSWQEYRKVWAHFLCRKENTGEDFFEQDISEYLEEKGGSYFHFHVRTLQMWESEKVKELNKVKIHMINAKTCKPYEAAEEVGKVPHGERQNYS